MKSFLTFTGALALMLGTVVAGIAADPTETPSSKSLQGKIKETPGNTGANQPEALPTDPKPDVANSPADKKEQMLDKAGGASANAGAPTTSPTANPKNPADKQAETQK